MLLILELSRFLDDLFVLAVSVSEVIGFEVAIGTNPERAPAKSYRRIAEIAPVPCISSQSH